MARVYVSSTYEDLKEFRAQVRLALQTLGHVAVAMETDGARPDRPVRACLRDVEQCDIYIGIVAWRYGYIPPGYKQSITELEYLRAVDEGKPRLIFLAKRASWDFELVELEALDRVQAFRQTLEENHGVSYFTKVADLRASLSEAVANWGKEKSLSVPGRGTDWDAYRGSVIAKHHLVPMETLTGPEQDRGVQIPLTNVFVTQQTATQAVDDQDAVAELREPSLQVIGRDAKQVILGEPGSGKSTLLRYTMLSLCDTGSGTTRPVGLRDRPLPFLIELRQYAREKSGGQVQDFIDYLATRAKEFYGPKIEPDELRALLQEDGQALVLFDGLDEILHEGERVKIADQLDAFARQYPGAKIVATSRIAGYNPERLQGYGFSHYTLRQFGLTEIREFLPRWYAHDAGREPERHAADLSDRIANNPRLRELAGNPLLLTMMAIINRHEELPERRWKLYERCTAVLLEHWDVKRKNIARDEVFPLGFQMTGDQKAQILRRVSMHMLRQPQADGRLNAIPRQPLMEILCAYLIENSGKNRHEADLIATEILNHLCERSYILTEIGEDTFGFVHRTFMEYFAACHVLAEFNHREANYDWLTSEVYGAHWRRDEWQEVLLLLAAMLAGQGSPIRKVVDHLCSPGTEEPPWSIVFAARCLAEAGLDDNAWSRTRLDWLAEVILGRTAQADAPGGGEPAEFINQALGAFSMLVLAVRPSEQLVAEIEASERIPRRHRMVVWQMKLALQPKEERLPFAIRALTDSVDTVRIGAITALEREWPGREDVGPCLLGVLRTDGIEHVRQAAVQALRRSWPNQPEILEAISERASDAIGFRHVMWLTRDLSLMWRQGFPALEVILRLAGTKHAAIKPRDYFPYIVMAAEAIVLGWSDWPRIDAWLRNRFAGEGDPHIRDAILLAVAQLRLAEDSTLFWLQEQVDRVLPTQMWAARSSIIAGISGSWAGRSELLVWLQRHAVDNEPEVRQIALAGLERGWREESPIRAWIGRRAIEDPDAEVRLHALALAGGCDSRNIVLTNFFDPRSKGLGVSWWPWEDATVWRARPRTVSLLEARAINDPSPLVRRAALSGVYAYRSSSTTATNLLCLRLTQEPDQDTRALILLWLTEAASGGTALPRGLAVTLGFADPNSHQVDRPFSGFAQPHTPEDDQLRAALTGVAENDEDENLRAAAAQAIAALWGDRPEVSEWLAERIRKDPSESARALLKSFRIR